MAPALRGTSASTHAAWRRSLPRRRTRLHPLPARSDSTKNQARTWDLPRTPQMRCESRRRGCGRKSDSIASRAYDLCCRKEIAGRKLGAGGKIGTSQAVPSPTAGLYSQRAKYCAFDPGERGFIELSCHEHFESFVVRWTVSECLARGRNDRKPQRRPSPCCGDSPRKVLRIQGRDRNFD